MSFTLVAGAVCAVYFNNAITYSTSSPTLNINSTGAKSLYPTRGSSNWTTQSYSNSGITFYARDTASKLLVYYNGSVYVAVGSSFALGGSGSYSDYSDSSSGEG